MTSPEPSPRTGAFSVPEDVAAHLEQMVQVLGAELPAAETREARAILQHEVSEFEERVRGDELSAARGYLAAFNHRPGFRPPLDALIRLYTRRRSTANLVKLVDALVKAAGTAAEKADALTLRGELLEDRLGDPSGARSAWEEAVLADPGARSAWRNLERVSLRDGDDDLLKRALARLAELTQDHGRRAMLLQELAEVHLRGGGPSDLEEAARCLRDAASLPVGRWRALQELERFGERHQRPQDVVFALEGRADLAARVANGEEFQGGSGAFAIARLRSQEAARVEGAELWSRAARLRLGTLHDADGARAAMDRCLELLPEDPRGHYLAMLLADEANDLGASSEQAAWLLAHDFGDPSLRASLHFRLAETHALRGDLAASEQSLRDALDLNPESAAARGALLEQFIASDEGGRVVEQYDQLAEQAAAGAPRAALRRAGAFLSLALRRDVEGALQRLRLASEDDPSDAVARRLQVLLLARSPSAERAPARVAAVDQLLPLVTDGAERGALLLERFFLERHDLKDGRAAALTAERLTEHGGGAWAMESAAFLWAASGAFAAASAWAERLARREDLGGGADEALAWSAVAARWAWAAGDAPRARALCLEAHGRRPAEPYLAALALRIAWSERAPEGVLEVGRRAAEASEGAQEEAWWMVTAGLLERLGARDLARTALDQALAKVQGSPSLRAWALASTRWRGDGALRAQLARESLDDPDSGAEGVALGVELALVRAFVEHDLDGAAEVLEAVALKDGAESVTVTLLHALLRGSREGPDAEGTVAALQEMLQALRSNDPLRLGVELEVARALGATRATRDQAAAARELIDEDRPDQAATRLLSLLDALQREDRRDVPDALERVASLADPGVARGFRTAALAALRAQGRAVEARQLALAHPGLPAGVLALSEATGGVERASELAEAHARRAGLAVGRASRAHARAAAHWSSLAGQDAEALERAEALLRDDPADLVALDVVRVAARRVGAWEKSIQACAALAARAKDPDRAAGYWEEAGVASADALRAAGRAEGYLRAALELAPARVVAWRKLRELLEARKDSAALEELLTRRAAVATDPAERVELFWDQARLRRALGRRELALESAQAVVALNPRHVAALALVAEIHAVSGRLAETADALVALARCPETPAVQRKAARLGAVGLFDQRLGRPADALAQLDALVAEGDADDDAVERGVSIATAAGLWDGALRFAERSLERCAIGSPERLQGLLRAAYLQRDRLRDPEAARMWAARAHEAFPGSLEALRALQALSDVDERPKHARATLEALRAQGPSGPWAVTFAEAARSGGDLVLERAALRLARTLGENSQAPAVGQPSGVPLKDSKLARLYRHPSDAGGRAVLLLETVLPDLVGLSLRTTDALKVGRSERVKGNSPLRSALEPWVAVAGVEAFELYVGGPEELRVSVLPGSPVAVVVARSVGAQLDEGLRFEFVRQLLLVARGCGALEGPPAETLAAQVMAALAAAEVPLAGGSQRFEAQLKPVARALTRRVRRAIAESARALGAAPDAWSEVTRAVLAVRASARRGALCVTGAVPAAFAELGRSEGRPGAAPSSLVATPSGRELALFAVSDALASVSRETGVDRR
ncbi:MAG: hypothetical protein HY909_15535 [Deltaproteobacteria bacterium]|nr:hypothetical protein [Deltaproteobacteria bacterium]